MPSRSLSLLLIFAFLNLFQLTGTAQSPGPVAPPPSPLQTKQILYAPFAGIAHFANWEIDVANRGNDVPATAQAQNAMESLTTDQVVNIPYFTLREGMSSTLTLQNRAPSETSAKVTLFNMEGRSQVLPAISIPSHSFKQITLRGVVASEEFSSGNIQVAFSGPPMILACQISVVSLENRVSFESRAQDTMDFVSADLNGILWLPQKEAKGFLAMTNTARANVTVEVAVGDDKQSVVLSSRETRLLDLSEGFGQPPTAKLVKLHHNGMPGEIITTGFVLNLQRGYSSSFAMIDSSAMGSNRLAGTHFRFGKPDPKEGFREDTVFRAPLLLANVSALPVKAQLSVDYSSEQPGQSEIGQLDSLATTRFGILKVKDITIAPGAVGRIELSDELLQLGVTAPVQDAGLDVVYDGSPGSVIAQLTSFDQTGDYSFEVPIKDPEAKNEAMEGVYPWSIENSTQSVLHLKNTTADIVGALVLFEFGGERFYNPDRIVLQPHQSVAIDVQELKNSQKPDVLNRAFPDEATHGLVQWRQEVPYTMIGRLERTDHKAGTASSFSCGFPCCQNFFESPFLSPNSVFGLVGGTAQLTAWVQGRSCNAIPFNNPVAPQPTFWTFVQHWRSDREFFRSGELCWSGFCNYFEQCKSCGLVHQFR
jgi:hypothetical protein